MTMAISNMKMLKKNLGSVFSLNTRNQHSSKSLSHRSRNKVRISLTLWLFQEQEKIYLGSEISSGRIRFVVVRSRSNFSSDPQLWMTALYLRWPGETQRPRLHHLKVQVPWGWITVCSRNIVHFYILSRYIKILLGQYNLDSTVWYCIIAISWALKGVTRECCEGWRPFLLARMNSSLKQNFRSGLRLTESGSDLIELQSIILIYLSIYQFWNRIFTTKADINITILESLRQHL